MKKKLELSETFSRKFFLNNLKEQNKESNVYITFKYMINKEKLKDFKEKNEKRI